MHARSVRFQLAMAFALISAAIPMSVALAQGEQAAEQVAGSLMSELTGMDVGRISLHKSGNDFTVLRPDGSSYEFTNVVRHHNGASGTVSMYNPKGVLIDSFTIHNGTNVPDQNKINFAVSSNGALTTGSITGLKSFPNQAIASIDKDGLSELFRVDYAGLDTTRVVGTSRVDRIGSVQRGQNADQLIAVSSMEMTTRGDPLTGLLIIVVVIIFVGATCLMFGWWGC